MLFIGISDEFDHMPKIMDRIIDRRSGKKKDLLRAVTSMQIILETVVALFFLASFTFHTGVAEVMPFVNNHNIGVFECQFNIPSPLALPLQVGVIIHNEVDKSAIDILQVSAYLQFPDILTRCFGCE